MRWLTRWKPQNSTHTHTDKVLLSPKQIGTVCFAKFLRFCAVAFCFCAFSFGASALTASYSCGSGGGTAPSSQTVTRNRTFTTRANTCTPPSGQEFTKWLVSGTTTTLNQNASYTWAWSSSKTLTAQYSAATYSVRYDCGDGGGTAPTDSNSPYNSGSSVRTLQNTCTPPSGKVFDKWSCNGTNVNAGSTFTISGNTTCTAQYVTATINLTWDGGGTPASCTYGGTFVPPTPAPRTGYVFTGWKIKPVTCGIPDLDYTQSGTGYGFSRLDGTAGVDERFYGLTSGSGEWAVRFSYGTVWGMANCNTTNGGSQYTVNDSLRTESDGQYCWCQVTGFTSYREDGDYSSGPECTVRPVSSSWVFIRNLNSYCANNCPGYCSSDITNRNLFQALFGAVGQ